VVTGIVQEFEFGINWGAYSRLVANIFGSPLAMEGLAAFFLESTFLGLWLFGWDKLSRRVHLLTIWLVSFGSALSYGVRAVVAEGDDGGRRHLPAAVLVYQCWSYYAFRRRVSREQFVPRLPAPPVPQAPPPQRAAATPALTLLSPLRRLGRARWPRGRARSRG
jgi:hypothetical protein